MEIREAPLRPVADLNPDNLRGFLEGLGPGWYTSADLYARYASACETAGTEPATHKKLGDVLRRIGFTSALRSHAGKSSRCWLISRKVLRAS